LAHPANHQECGRWLAELNHMYAGHFLYCAVFGAKAQQFLQFAFNVGVGSYRLAELPSQEILKTSFGGNDHVGCLEW